MTLVPGGDENSELLAISEYGLGKRTAVQATIPAKGAAAWASSPWT